MNTEGKRLSAIEILHILQLRRLESAFSHTNACDFGNEFYQFRHLNVFWPLFSSLWNVWMEVKDNAMVPTLRMFHKIVSNKELIH